MGGHGSHELNTATRGCKGNGQSECEPYLQHHLELWRKSFSNNTFWRLNYFMLELLIVLYFELENLNHEPYKLILIQCL
jgi:hypothetical protein